MKRLAAACLCLCASALLRAEDPQALAQDFVRLVRSLGDLGGDPNTLAARRRQAILLYEDFLASHPESVYSAMVRWSLFSSYLTVERQDKAGQVLDDLQDALLRDLLKVAFAKQRMGNPAAGRLLESLEKAEDGAVRMRVAQYMLTIGQDPQQYLALLQEVIDRPANGDEVRARAQLVKADLFRYGEQKVPLLAELVKKFPATRAGREGARKLAAASLAQGAPALPFTVTAADGTTVASEALRGKAVLLFFWSTWSYPSWKRIDELKKELGVYAPDRLAVIAVACEDFIERPKEFFANEKIAWSLVAEGKEWHNTLALLYDVNSLPYYILIDAKGNVVIPGTTKTEDMLKALPNAIAR